MKSIKIALGFILILAAVSCSGATPQATTLPPTTTKAPTQTPTPMPPMETPIPAGPLGSISGKIIPPYTFAISEIRVIAREVNTNKMTSIEITNGQAEYTISNLPVGTYYVLGWYFNKNVSGAYTSAEIKEANTSGQQLECNTSIIPISIKPGNMDFQGADIGCWAGDYWSYITPMP